MKKIILSLITIIAIAAGAYFAFQEDKPTITYHTIDGKDITSNDLKGKVVLVKFWATTCVTCIRQMPDTIHYYNTYKDQGYDTIAVAMNYDKPAAIEKFRQDRELPFTIVHDKTGEIAKAFGHIRFTPVAFLIDRKGNIVKRYIGAYDKEEFIQTLEKTLAKPS
ncbi:peroxiredoxin family protein [Pelistega ratti]|uniref:peroxiredoxin family protein n=1 Tax=Pelistega ratti TaxID=2652177 RepID=UPI00135CCEE7|nr:TlpA disulfide reductase family protein [Pelistega ratti]